MKSDKLIANSSDDSYLNRFSYMLLGIIENNTVYSYYPLGTCFFINKSDKIYLVTAAHNVFRFNTFDKTNLEIYDKIGLRYFDSVENKFVVKHLDFKMMMESFPREYFYVTADAVAIHWPDPSTTPYILCLDDEMLLDEPENLITENIISVGFYYIDSSKFQFEMQPLHYNGKIVPNPIHSYPKNDNIYYVSTPKSTMGISGGPVFKKYFDQSGEIKYLFSGVIFGANVDLNYAYVAKREAIVLIN